MAEILSIRCKTPISLTIKQWEFNSHSFLHDIYFLCLKMSMPFLSSSQGCCSNCFTAYVTVGYLQSVWYNAGKHLVYLKLSTCTSNINEIFGNTCITFCRTTMWTFIP